MTHRTMAVGDIHGEKHTFGALLKQERPDLVLCCGDFGVWPGTEHDTLQTETRGAQVHFCDGNHENFQHLLSFRKAGPPQAYEVAPGIWWHDRGSTLDLPDGRRVLFWGGAESDEEGGTPTRDDLKGLPDCRADIVISHTSPRCFEMGRYSWRDATSFKVREPTRLLLNRVFAKYRPKLWYFGHWHQRRFGTAAGCRWTCLDMLPPPQKTWEQFSRGEQLWLEAYNLRDSLPNESKKGVEPGDQAWGMVEAAWTWIPEYGAPDAQI